jgi:hypothetical protein
MNNQFKNALRCTVAAYAGVQLTDVDIKKLDLAVKIALANTICNIHVHGLIFTARWAICEDRIQFSFHKEDVHNRLTTMYYDNEILCVEDIKGPYNL